MTFHGNDMCKGAKVTRSTRSYALPLFNPVPELSGPELASKSKDVFDSGFREV